MNKNLIILCGGKGTRLGALTKNKPKALMLINNIPFLEIILKKFISLGVSKIVLATGHFHDQIKSIIGYEFFNKEIIYSHEKKPLGTGGAIKKAFQLIEDDTSFVINGDTFIDINAEEIACLCEKNNSILVMKSKSNTRYSNFYIKNNKIMTVSGIDRPQNLYINTGLYFLEKKIFKAINEDCFSFEEIFLSKFIDKFNFRPLITNTYFIDIGIPLDLERFKLDFKSIFFNEN
jgi:D-glycero-alpha-D-manno-heptose 1-phosphate guanylyltransferase